MLAITLVSVFLCVAVVMGMAVAFEDIIGLHPVCAESVQVLYHEKVEEKVVNPFSVPEDMVFWGEEVLLASQEADMEFWPEVEEVHAFTFSAVHCAMIAFWKQERVISWTMPYGELNDSWFWTAASV